MAGKPKGGPLARRAAMLCNDKEFCKWLDRRRKREPGYHTPEITREWMVGACKIKSRAELDHIEDAATMFKKIAAAFKRDTINHNEITRGEV